MLAELNGKNNDAALVTYTWGPDLSGTFGGAGGVGGLLGISKKTVPTANLACLYDGNGNITQLVDMATGDAKAHYEYDPFGNLIQSEVVSGLQTWNKFRFSTKQIEEELLIPTTSSSAGVSPNLYYFGYRFYSPRLGRWINRDPIGEIESLNLLFFCKNEPNNYIDILGNSFKDWLPVIGVYISLNKSLRWEIEFDYLECVKCTVPKNYPAAHLVGTDEHSCLECMKDLR